AVGECARRSRRTAGQTAELPIQSDRSQARRSGELIVGDVVDLECAGVDVAQDQVGCAGGADGSDTRVLPIQSDRADKGGTRELVVVDVVDFQSARAAVA